MRKNTYTKKMMTRIITVWSLRNYGIPTYYDYTEYAPLLNVDYWKIN